MTQLSQNKALSLIEDQLDSIGQKHRLAQIMRGLMLWTAWGIVAATAAALAADAFGQGTPALCVVAILGVWLCASALFWIARPIITRTSTVTTARLVERRIGGLHNGLTNSVLLARSPDIAHNPWLGMIYEEVAANCRRQPLHDAVKFSDLGPLGLRLGGVTAAALLIAFFAGGRVAHGWQQMLAPSRFVPKVGKVEIVDVQPGDATLVAGQPLEISIQANGPQSPPPAARLVFDGNMIQAELPAAVGTGAGQLGYSYRMDHVDVPLRYRVEVGGTQTRWYSVQIVPGVTLDGLQVHITPPAYTLLPARDVSMSGQDAAHAQIIVRQGSRVEIGAAINVPMKRAVLMVDNQSPADMAAAAANRQFTGRTTVMADSTVFVGVLGGDQVIAKLPENGLSIHCIPDAPPTITMRSPAQDETIAPTHDLTITADLRDDFGVSSARLLVGFGDADPQPLAASEQRFADGGTARQVQFPLKLTADQAQHDSIVTVQVEATDNRDLTAIAADLGPQSARGRRIVIHMRDPAQIALEAAAQADQLAAKLREMIKLQQSLHDRTVALLPATRPSEVDRTVMGNIGGGQSDLRQAMKTAGQTDGTELEQRVRVVKKTLLVLSVSTATEAVDLANEIVAEPLAAKQADEGAQLSVKQESIVATLAELLAGLGPVDDPATRSSVAGSPPMPSEADAFKKLDEALAAYEKDQRRILNQTAPLAKKPVDDFDQNDKKNLADLQAAQDKLDAFMQQNLADFAKGARQDMSNPALLKELMQIYTDVTMAKNALAAKSAETAVPLEQSGLDDAKSLKANIEKFLNDAPDRQSLTQADEPNEPDPAQAELPKELQDMIGDLLEQQEDLDQQMQQSANRQSSMDPMAGWTAKDGPISDNSAQGISSNVLPQNNDVQGRSGEGRSAQSSGEFVGDKASGKGGRNTPTRLDPTPFQAGQVQDSSKDPAGGATGGGKISGMGASGLEGPVPPKPQQEMKRLAQMQAQLRNEAERLNLQYKLGRYDNFKLLQSIVEMRQVESDLHANRYANALHNTDVLVNDLTTSDILLGGRIQVQQDTTPTASHRTQKEIDDAAEGDLPPVWSEALKEYYRKLAEQ